MGRARAGPGPSPPSLLSPVLLRSGCQYELGKEDPEMSVYVGIDVHRKRSQVAVVDGAGEVQVNRNVANGVEPILRVMGEVPVGTRWRSRPPTAGGGWWSSWRTTGSSRIWCTRLDAR